MVDLNSWSYSTFERKATFLSIVYSSVVIGEHGEEKRDSGTTTCSKVQQSDVFLLVMKTREHEILSLLCIAREL